MSIQLQHNSQINLFGVTRTLNFHRIRTAKPSVIVEEQYLRVHRSELYQVDYQDILEDWFKSVIKDYILDRVEYYSDLYGFEYNQIRIKSQRSRWGSCSSKKNLNFNWRLIFAPPKCLDYVIIHELAHTKELNHSRDFWNLVASCMPDYRDAEKWLKKNGRELF